MQLSTIESELSGILKELHVSADVLSSWKEEIYRAAQKEQSSQSSIKVIISPQEKEFLIKTSQSQTMPTRLKNLCEAAKELYGQQYDRVIAGSSAGHENVACTNAGEVVSDGENILVEKVSTHLRNRMERHHFSIAQMVYNMARLGDSSKQRTRIRRKVSIEKELLQKVVTKYNQLVGESAKVSLESIENGVFPWHVTVSSVDDRVPRSTKRAAVEKQMEIDRFKEELPLIKREMNSFISFYKDRIIPEIDKKKKELQISLNGNSVYYAMSHFHSKEI